MHNISIESQRKVSGFCYVYRILQMRYSRQLIDNIMSYVDTNGMHLICRRHGKLAFRSRVLESRDFKDSALAARIVEATHFLDKSIALPYRVKAVLNGIDHYNKCIVCGKNAEVSNDKSLSSSMFNHFCNSTSCMMSYMSRSRKTTMQSRLNHSKSMSLHKKKLVGYYNSVLDKFYSSSFTTIKHEDVYSYAKCLVDGHSSNGSPIPQRDWKDSQDLMCSILAYTNFISISKHASSLQDMRMLERLYCLAHRVKQKPVCKFCGKPVKFFNIKHGYFESCATCEQEKRRTTMGTLTYAECTRLVDRRKYELLDAPSGRVDDTRKHLVIKCKKCGSISKIALHCGNFAKIVKDQRLCKNCEKYSSKEETELKSVVSSIVGSNRVHSHDRSLISPYELDIVVPSKKVAIEYNGSYWHNAIAVNSNYHMLKTMKCEQAGYRLVHIFEHEWKMNKDACIDIVKRALGHRMAYVDANQCSICTCHSTKDIEDFAAMNGLCQLPTNSSIILSLCYGQKTMAVAAFSKSRMTLKLDYYVEKIGTYVNNALAVLLEEATAALDTLSATIEMPHGHFTIDDFSRQGLHFLKYVQPKAVWTRDGKLVSISRVLSDPLKYMKNFDSSKTLEENLKAHRYCKIYDAGSILMSWHHHLRKR